MKQVFEAFEAFLEQSAPKIESIHPYFEQAAYEMVLNGGKRFRPKLFLSVVEAFEPLLLPSSYPVALAIETLHTYSLIHDDLPSMDNAALRRGHPTLHTKYDEVSAILAGDGLNTYSFYLIVNAPLSSDVKVGLIKELAFCGGFGGMVAGQAVDCYFENTPLDEAQIKAMHIDKTGKLIAASLKMGAITVDVDKVLQKELFVLGIKMGLLFQINDDIVDVTETSEQAGKDTQNDGNKNSYVTIMGLEKAQEERAALQQEIASLLEGLPPKLAENLKNLIKHYL